MMIALYYEECQTYPKVEGIVTKPPVPITQSQQLPTKRVSIFSIVQTFPCDAVISMSLE